MTAGAQWTALWYRVADWQLICAESLPWDGGTGGYGYTECQPSPDLWQPGEFEVQIFVGLQWVISSRFTVTGDAPTAIPSATPTLTPSLSPTATPTLTKTPTQTPLLTQTPTLKPTTAPASTQTPTR
jgi:type VI secretion system secreted protein VgrG